MRLIDVDELIKYCNENGIMMDVDAINSQPELVINVDMLIALIAHLYDHLRVYKDILETGDCNNCDVAKGCIYRPEAGQMVRYNCPFYFRGEE